MGIPFIVEASELAEPVDRPGGCAPTAWVEALAYYKARAVAARRPGAITLGADTIVVCAGEILNKPQDEADARRMLVLQGSVESQVITGVALVTPASKFRRRLFHDVTRVWMRDDATEREAYLASGDWRGKAGAYGIQTVGDRLVARFDGSFANVVGLPTEKLRRVLNECP